MRKWANSFPAVFISSAYAVIWVSGLLFAQTGSTYTDSRGKKVNFPLGDLSFADAVVTFTKGKPSSAEKYCDPGQMLGPPDYMNDYQEPPGYTTPGCDGTLIVRFTDNVLVDVDGPDLYVFEIGPDVESTDISISKDGENWVHVGKVSGWTAEMEIASHTSPDP